MAYTFSLDDVAFLRGAAAAAALAVAGELPLTDATLLADLPAVRRVAPDHAAAVVETVRLRRRAVPRLGPGAAVWLFTDEALQQASPLPVARHRAARLAGFGVHDLTCSIGADLASLTAACPVALGSDLDPVRLAMAAHNVRAADLPVRLSRSDALTVTSTGLLGYADPARRTAAGRRITSIDTLPSVADLDRVHAARPPVLRLPPGIDYDRLARPGEVEIVSLDGSAREAVLWPPELAAVGRRATVLSSSGLSSSGGGFEVTDADPDDAVVGPVGAWIVDPDPAVVRAHLVRHWAQRHGLHLLDPHLAYLSGPAPPPHIRGFEVLDVAPYREKTVAGWLRRDGIGTLEIKQRGTPVIPDDLRRRLRPAMSGDTTAGATLIIARIGSDPVAYWCRASW